MTEKVPKEAGGVPLGGTTGQVLVKASNADNDVAWGSQGTYPLIIASGTVDWGSATTNGTNLTWNFSTKVIKATSVANMSSAKYAIHITPYGSHEAWSIAQAAGGFTLNIWDRSGTSRIGYGGLVNITIMQNYA